MELSDFEEVSKLAYKRAELTTMIREANVYEDPQESTVRPGVRSRGLRITVGGLPVTNTVIHSALRNLLIVELENVIVGVDAALSRLGVTVSDDFDERTATDDDDEDASRSDRGRAAWQYCNDPISPTTQHVSKDHPDYGKS